MTGAGNKKEKNAGNPTKLKKEDGKVHCKICKKYFPTKSLLRHIGQTTACKNGYGKEFEELKSANRKKINTEYNRKNAIARNKTPKPQNPKTPTGYVRKLKRYVSFECFSKLKKLR